MDWIVGAKAAVLGVVEGLTEFIPVSSTGHLIVTSHLLGWGSPTFEIFIQLGAILALTWVYRMELWVIAIGALRPGPEQQFVGKTLLAFVPAAVLGLATHDWIEEHLFRADTVALSLFVGGVLILVIDRPGRLAADGHEGARQTGPQRHPKPVADARDLTWMQALWIGLGQMLALFPGMSRSGATILAGLLAGLSRKAATEFSFYLALPTIYAASLFALWKARHELASGDVLPLAIGFVAAFVSALVVIRAFLRFVQTSSLRPFAWYRIAAALAVVGWLFVSR